VPPTPSVTPPAHLQLKRVVVIGGSAGIGLATARAARAHGAEVILTARNPERLATAAQEIGAAGTAAFDAADPDALERFFAEVGVVDHVLVSAGRPYYAPLAELNIEQAKASFDDHLWLAIRIAKLAPGKVRRSLTFISGTGGRKRGIGLSVISAATAAAPAIIENLALEIAPIRVNLLAPGFVDTGLSAELLGEGLEARREQLRGTLPIARVVGPEDVASAALFLMENSALTGVTIDVDGGQKLV
jgi:NAD(P)-dependent dehydrogenase (short-subunit alcohol dehydrogenase family)